MREAAEKLQIAYDGPALQGGRMEMLPLGSSLRGQAPLIQRVKEILYGDQVPLRVEVDHEFRSGSLVVPVHILTNAITTAEHLLSGQAVTAVANLLQILGFFGVSGVSIYKLFKRRKGRRIETPEDIPDDLQIDISIELLIRIYNDPEVQRQLRRTLEPLRHDGIEEFQTRREGVVIESVLKADLRAADEAEVQDLTKDYDIALDIEKSAWRRDLAWHFSDGRASFDAKIEDDSFWKRIDGGEAFAEGDRLKVHLRTVAQRTAVGGLKVERTIPTVIEVEHVRQKQRNLFEGDSTDETL